MTERMLRGRSIGRLWKEMGLGAAGATDRKLEVPIKTQMVLDEMSADPSRKAGPAGIKERIAHNQGVHLKRSVTQFQRHMRLMENELGTLFQK